MADSLFGDILNNLDKERTAGRGFEYGTHVVKIGEAEAVSDKKGRDIIRVTVFDPEDNDRTAEATLWFHSEGGTKMSVDKVLRLIIHNVDEDKKPLVRDLGEKIFSSITDLSKARDAALKLITEKLIGKEGYLVVTPTGKYSTSKYGDLWYYPAAPVAEKIDPLAGSTPVDNSDLPDDF